MGPKEYLSTGLLIVALGLSIVLLSDKNIQDRKNVNSLRWVIGILFLTAIFLYLKIDLGIKTILIFASFFFLSEKLLPSTARHLLNKKLIPELFATIAVLASLWIFKFAPQMKIIILCTVSILSVIFITIWYGRQLTTRQMHQTMKSDFPFIKSSLGSPFWLSSWYIRWRIELLVYVIVLIIFVLFGLVNLVMLG